MIVSRQPHAVGTNRSRIAIFSDSTVTATEALSMSDPEITFDFMMRAGVKSAGLRVAGQGPAALRARGAVQAENLRQLGFDSLDLCNADFCNEASLAYGAEAVKRVFLVSAVDAVNLAGTEAMYILNVAPVELLLCCVGFPGEAAAVLQQLPHGAALHGVSVSVLLDCGLRAQTLAGLGYSLPAVCSQCSASGEDLRKLGYAL